MEIPNCRLPGSAPFPLIDWVQITIRVSQRLKVFRHSTVVSAHPLNARSFSCRAYSVFGDNIPRLEYFMKTRPTCIGKPPPGFD